jgi:predicted kinase
VELVILVGLPGSGKSTFYRERLAATHAIVSKDLLKREGRPGRRQEALIAAALAAGRAVAVDNTNPRVADREPLVALARAHGARVVAYVFRSTVAECRARNRLREGPARVPDVAIFAAARRMEAPTLGEGLDALYYVTLLSPSGFSVTPAAG